MSTNRLQDAAMLAGVRPDVAALAARLTSRLAADGPPAASEPVWLHGDVHLKNAILTDE